jgi:hypothetical protein
MDEEEFRSFLRRGGRSPNAADRCVARVRQFERYLQEQQEGRCLDGAGPDDLEGFVTSIERAPKTSAKTHLWAIHYYYDYTSNEEMRNLAGALREKRIQRTPLALAKFRGANPDYVNELARTGIRNVNQMLEAGRSQSDREALASGTGVPLEAILEFVKLSDLARIPGMKGIRSRLYYDAGVDTVDKLAAWDPEALRAMLVDFVARTGFDGIAPLPKEAAFSVATAKKLPRIVEY